MKKSTLIIAGLILSLAFTGCTRGSSASNAGNKPSEIASTDAETESKLVTEKPTREPTTVIPAENPTMGNAEKDYNAEEAKRVFEESDIPDSIKNVFLSDGEFVDTQTQTEMKLVDYKLYNIIYSHDETDADIYTETYDLENWREVEGWLSYIAVDYDGDGKKELLYAADNGIDGVIFHEHTDGKVYAYGHESLRVQIGENGDVVGSAGAVSLSADSLLRYSFDTEKIIVTYIAYAKWQNDGEYKYYIEGREVDVDEYSTYFSLLSKDSLNWIEFRITPDSGENKSSGN